MGESIEEATITNWFVKEGDAVQEDDVLLEIATDKVDSEIPSPVEGVVKKILFKQDEVVAVGTVIAVIGLDGDDAAESSDKQVDAAAEESTEAPAEVRDEEKGDETISSSRDRFYSPLVRTIAGKEGVSQEELDALVAFAESENLPLIEEQWETSLDQISLLMKGYMARDLWSMAHFYEIYNASNEVFKKAVEILKDPAMIYQKLAEVEAD